MTDPVYSSKWTGPVEDGLQRKHPGAFTHAAGQHSITNDYFHLMESERAANAIPPAVGGVMRLGWMLLFSPAALWLGWLIVDLVTPDIMVGDNRAPLMLWGLAAVALGAWQARSRSRYLIALRKAVLSVGIVATVAAAVVYSYLGISAHGEARASIPERSFELVKTSGRRIKSTTVWHQRADGTTVEGSRKGRPLPYSRTCALVQSLDGPHGFSWVRVLERSRAARRGQLDWPVRREDCFSNIPLSSLPR